MAMNTRQLIGTIMGDLAGVIGKIGDLLDADEECKLDAPLTESHLLVLDDIKKRATDIYKEVTTIYSSRDEKKTLIYRRSTNDPT